MVYLVAAKTETKGKQSQRCNICFQIIHFTCKSNVYYESTRNTYFRRLSFLVLSVLARFSNVLKLYLTRANVCDLLVDIKILN